VFFPKYYYGDEAKEDETGVRGDAHEIVIGKPKGRDCLEYLGVDWRIILKWLLKKWGVRMWIECMCISVGTSGDLL
jgi:hypothetical protein